MLDIPRIELKEYARNGIIMMSSDTTEKPAHKPVHFLGNSRKRLREFPKLVRRAMGEALLDAQDGEKHPNAKPLKGFGGASVVEIVEDFNRNAYRVIYTVRFAERIYVLHAFQKKSKSGIKTPAHELDVLHDRLKEAAEIHKEWLAEIQGH